MEIKKKHIDPTQNPQNPIAVPETTPQPPLSKEQKKIASVGLGAIGKLTAPKKTPPPSSLLPTGEIQINMDLLAFELQEIEQMTLFIFNALGQLESFKGEPALAAMAIIGKDLFIKDAHHEAFKTIDKTDAQFASIDFDSLEITVIPEELWGDLHIQIANLKPLILAIVPETQEAAAPEKEQKHPHPNKTTKQAPPAAPRFASKGTSRSMKWEQAKTLFLAETNKILKAAKERHEQEKMEEEKAHKEEIIKKEIENYEEKLKLIKESATQEEMFAHLKDWSESLPPCPIRLLNAMTLWRELVNKCLVSNALG